MKFRSRISRLMLAAAFIAMMSTLGNGRASAEVNEVKFATQFGLGHFPMMLMLEHKWVEQGAKEAGLGNVTTKLFRLAGAAAMNDALLSKSVDFTSGSIMGVATLWSASNGKVKAALPMDSLPAILMTVNPKVKSLKDFTPNDKIGLPAVKVSIQAIVLQMAAQKQFGDYSKLDGITVTMKHPDAMAALLSGSGAVNSHFAFPPFDTIEAKSGKAHQVLNSFDVLGPSTIVVMATRTDFPKENPKIYKVVVDAMKKSIDYINSDKRRAAEEYIKITNDKSLTVDELTELLNKPDMIYSTTPKGTMSIVKFMHERGIIKRSPSTWKDLYFPNVHDAAGAD